MTSRVKLGFAVRDPILTLIQTPIIHYPQPEVESAMVFFAGRGGQMFGLSDVGARVLSKKPGCCGRGESTGVNPAGDAGDTSPPQYFGRGNVNGNIPQYYYVLLDISRPTFVGLRSLSLKPISFGYKTPPIRFSQAGRQSAHKARPPNLELALTPLGESAEGARPPSTDRKRERERLPGLSGFEALFMNDGSDDERRRAVDILVCRAAAAAAAEGTEDGSITTHAGLQQSG